MKEQKCIKVLTYFYLAPFAVMIGFNTINSLLRTTYFELYQVMEPAKYEWDNFFLVFIASAAALAMMNWLMNCKWVKKINIEKISLTYSVLVSLFIVLLFRCVVSCDSGLISDAVIGFLEENYYAFEQGDYLYRYPFQVGFAALLELIYYLFGVENFIAFQLINILCIYVILKMLGKITGELFQNEKICRIEGLLAMGMLPLFLYATFVYGDVIGWSFGVSGIYFMIRYLKTDRWQNILKASLLLSAGIVVKSNINILIVAAVIILFLHILQNKKFQMLMWIPGIILISQIGIWGIGEIYAARAGLDELPKGIPKIAWVAMGLQEGDEGGYACGWYNAYNCVVYEENHYDQQFTTQACIENLKESCGRFLHEQRYAIDYFYKKFTSQWNAPTFQSLLTNEWNSRNVENLSPLARFFIYGTGREILYQFMNIYHFFIFFCAGIYCWRFRKNWSMEGAYFVMNIFGGFLFHMLWEAKARYILGYFVLLLPLAAFGLNEILKKTDGLYRKRRGQEV